MTDPARPFELVTVFGGSGFLGEYVVNALAKRNYRIRVAVRSPNTARTPQVFGMVGQVQAVAANLRSRDQVARAVRGAGAVVNLVGILQPSGAQTFAAVQAEGAETVAEAAAAAGARLVHVSALGADLASGSAYARSKAEGEVAVKRARPDAVVLRPSLIFGPGDSFFNRFAALSRMLPVLPLAGADTRFQPVYAGDVAEAVARAVDGAVPGGRTYELGGPETRTLRELVDYMLETVGAEADRRFAAATPGAHAGHLARGARPRHPRSSAERSEAHARPGRPSAAGQRRVRGRGRGGTHLAGPRHRADRHGGDRAVLSGALPPARAVRPQRRRRVGHARRPQAAINQPRTRFPGEAGRRAGGRSGPAPTGPCGCGPSGRCRTAASAG